MSEKKPWEESMPSEQFEFMRDVLAAPSPVGLEAAMTMGGIKPRFESIALEGWGIHQFVGNAGIVLDTHPGLEFLLESPQYHERYIDTVIARMFYAINRWVVGGGEGERPRKFV